jgi:hypothetical protein
MDTHRVNTDSASIKKAESLSILKLNDIKGMVVWMFPSFVMSLPESKCAKEAVIPNREARQKIKPGITLESLWFL